MNRIFILILSLSVAYSSYSQPDYSSDFYVYDNKGKLQQTIRFDEVKAGANDFIIVSKDGKYGIYNYKSNEITTELVYRDIAAVFNNNLALAKNKYEKWGLIDLNTNNHEVLSFEYYQIVQLDNRYYTVTKFDRKWGVYDVIEKRFVIPCQYDSRIGLKNEVFVLKHQNQYAFYGKQGEIVMPFQKQKFYLSYQYPLANIHRNKKTLLFNTSTLEYQTELEFEEYPIVFGNEYAIVTVKGRKHFLHHSGKLLTEQGFEEIDYFNDHGFAKVKINGRWGVVDKQGKIVVDFNYDNKDSCPELFRNGYHTVRKGSSAGVQRLDGSWLIEPTYYYFLYKDNGIMAFKEKQAFTLFDYNGNVIKSLPPNETIEPFGNVYLYTREGKISWMNKRFKVCGEFANMISFEKIENSNLIELEVMNEDWRYGIINQKGKLVIPADNILIQTYHVPFEILFVQNENEKWGAYNLKGKEIIETKYSRKINLNAGWSVFAE